MAVHKALHTHYFIWSSLQPSHVGIISNLSIHSIDSYLYSGYDPNQTTSQQVHRFLTCLLHQATTLSSLNYFKNLSSGFSASTQWSEWPIMYTEVWLCRFSAQSHPVASYMIPNKPTVLMMVYEVFYDPTAFLFPISSPTSSRSIHPRHPDLLGSSFFLSLNTTSTVESQIFCIHFPFINYAFQRYLCAFHPPFL